jgi:DNA (cytosine-5)-methyltransferase 1
MKIFSIFSGIGGFELGIKQSGLEHEIVGYSEIAEDSIKVYETHFPNHKNFGDVTNSCYKNIVKSS